MTPRWQRREFLRLALIQLGAWPLVSTVGCYPGGSSRGAGERDNKPPDGGEKDSGQDGGAKPSGQDGGAEPFGQDGGAKPSRPDAGATEPEPTIHIGAAVHERIAQLQRDVMLDAYFADGVASNLHQIGARYLELVAPDQTDEEILAALEPTIRRIERHLSDDGAIEALRNAVTSEFEAVEVFDFEGWTLAPTECALCALLWLAEQETNDDAGV